MSVFNGGAAPAPAAFSLWNQSVLLPPAPALSPSAGALVAAAPASADAPMPGHAAGVERAVPPAAAAESRDRRRSAVQDLLRRSSDIDDPVLALKRSSFYAQPADDFAAFMTKSFWEGPSGVTAVVVLATVAASRALARRRAAQRPTRS